MRIDDLIEWALRIGLTVYVLFVMAFLFSGCATQPTAPSVVLTPISTPCVEAVPEKPLLKSDKELKALSDYALVITVIAERYRLILWGDELEAVLSGCK